MKNIPIFVINMEACVERWESTSSKLSALGLHPIRFDATVGRALSNEEIEQHYDAHANRKYHHRNLTVGEIGCYISHQNLWKKISEEKIPYCLILEDDLCIDDKLPSLLKHVEQLKGWDMIKLFDNRDNLFIDSMPLDNTFTLGNFLKVPNCTAAYALSLSGAEKLLKRKLFFRAVDVDIQFHSEVGISVVGIRPYPFTQDKTFVSEIGVVNGGRHSNHSSFWRNLKFRIKMYFERKKLSADLTEISQ